MAFTGKFPHEATVDHSRVHGAGLSSGDNINLPIYLIRESWKYFKMLFLLSESFYLFFLLIKYIF